MVMGLILLKIFIDFCWTHRIRPFLLPAHSTHLTQPLDVGVFQSFKKNFKDLIRKEVFLGATTVSKPDFFALFQSFSDKTFIPELCKSAFRKAGLIPLNPDVVLDQMKSYGGVQEEGVVEVEGESDPESEPGFSTPPPPNWTEYNTPITNTQRKRGSEYVRAKSGQPFTPIAIRVLEKVEKGSAQLILKGQLATELVQAQNSAAAKRKERTEGPNKVVQKYGEIYGHQAMRQIAEDEKEEREVVNMRHARQDKLWKKRAETFIKNYPNIFKRIRNQGYFPGLASLQE
jgi:DDE superfamily endonuclease